MEVRWHILILIICASVVTVLPRVIPLMVLSRFQLPDWILRWLQHIPIAVMAALVGQQLLMSGQKLVWFNDVGLAAGVAAVVVAVLTRSLLWTVIAGVVSTMVLRMLFL